MHEKHGVIEEGRTPPEDDEKRASEDQLEDHLTKRAANVAEEELSK